MIASYTYQALLVLVIALSSIFFSSNLEIFLYDRNIFSELELWRLVTGHLSHFSLEHGLFNIIALTGLLIVNEKVISLRCLISYILLFAILLSLSFYIFIPDLSSYAGLSGVLHGLFTTIAIYQYLYASKVISITMILIIIVKLVYENVFNQTLTIDILDGIRVLKEAHWYGVLWAVVITPMVIVVQRILIR